MYTKTIYKMVSLILTLGITLTHITGCSSDSTSSLTSSESETPTGGYNIIESSQSIEGQDSTEMIDEQLDDNLYISAEFKMPGASLYKYSTELKNFDYNSALYAIDSDGIGTIGGEAGSLIYVRDDMSNHLDTYCSYAVENNMAENKDLSFLSRANAILTAEEILTQIGVNGDLTNLTIYAFNKDDMENIKAIILTDDDYSGMLSAKNYTSDSFDDNLEVYNMEFTLMVNGIAVFNNKPVLQMTRDILLAQAVNINVLLSNNGVERIMITGAMESFEDSKEQVSIIDEEGIKAALLNEFGNVILPYEYRVRNIWMEYFPLLRDGSFSDIDLIPVWCLDFEVDGKSVEDSQYTLRFNAITGEIVS